MRLLRLKKLCQRNGWVPISNLLNPSNPAVHAATTGQEILEDFGAEGLMLLLLVSVLVVLFQVFLKTLKAANPRSRFIPAVLERGDKLDHRIQGISQPVSYSSDTLIQII